jgi:hypothetical protein
LEMPGFTGLLIAFAVLGRVDSRVAGMCAICSL